MLDFKEITKGIEFNPLTIREDTPFTQSFIYGAWQEMAGHNVRRFEIKQGEEITGFFQVITYSLPLSKNILYIPHGPVLRQGYKGQADFLKEFHKKLTEISKEENVIFVRFDIFPKTEEVFSKVFKKIPGYAYHSFYFQPKFDWILDLNKKEEKLTGEMHPKTKYNINLATRKGVKVEIIKDNFEQYFEDFYRLMEETAKRDHFNLHQKIYYQNIFQTLNPNNAFLAVARYDDTILLVNLILLYGKTAYFIFGGSSDNLKNLMFSHLAQWESIREAKRLAFDFYNFGGVGHHSSYETYGGISVFKKRFGGEIFEHSDSYDIVLNQFWYYLYNIRKWLLNLT